MDDKRKAVAEAMKKQADKKKPQTLRGIKGEIVKPKYPATPYVPNPGFIRG